MGSLLEKNSANVRKRIEGHTFHDEQGEEYEGSKFGGFADYFRRKKIKLQNLDTELRSQSESNPLIFRGIVAHVNGYTQPSLADLHKLIVTHGGGFLQYLDNKTAVTHVIAANLTPKKRVEFARYRIVKPAWVVDSVKAGKVMPWENYRAVDEGEKQKVLGFQDGNIVTQANTQRHTYREQTDASWYTSQMRGVVNDLGSDAQAGSSVNINDIEDTFDSDPLRQGKGTSSTEGDDEIPNTKVGADESFGINDDLFNDLEDGQEPKQEADAPDTPSGVLDLFKPGTLAREPADETGRLVQPHNSPEKRQLTAEEHNARLLSNPHMAKSSSANPDFINQYYRESRLHHLSAWKSELKAQLQARAMQKSASQTDQHKREPATRRYVMHVDFDSFFAAVSLRKNPDLVDKPVVIAHGSGPGSEIASCNYPARTFGVKNGMWMKTALELCKDLKVLPYDYSAYEEASKHFYDSILAMDGIVQSISIDEALIDISVPCIQAGGSNGKGVSEGSIYREQEKANELATSLRGLVREKTGCEVSIGIGNNILLAKVALRKAKPAGQHLIKPEDVLDFIGELTVKDLPGVAYSIGGKLEEIGIKYVKDIRNITKERLINTLGPKTGEKLWDYSRGIDKVEVGEQVIRKSVSAEINWGIRFVTQQQAEEFVQCLCDELRKRMLENLVKGKQLTMKIMRRAADAPIDPPKNLGHGKCDTFNKSVLLGVATNDSEVLGREAISILRGYGFSPGELRGLGVQMQKLEPLKPLASAASPTVDSSQRRLQFKKPAVPPTANRPSFAEPTLPKHDRSSSPQVPTPLRNEADPIEEVPTPEKSRYKDVINGAFDASRQDDPKLKPLNIAGTQFILPTQVDPAVLAELPQDIRSMLAPKQSKALNNVERADSLASDPGDISRSASPYVSDGEAVLPNQSQLDPEVLKALPEDVRREVLAEYERVGHGTKIGQRNQQVLPQSPQSPRNARPVLSKKLLVTPAKNQKSTKVVKTRKRRVANGESTLTQSNLVATMKHNVDVTGNVDDEISQSFLDELPEDIRAEVIAEQKRSRIAKAGLKLGAARWKAQTVPDFVPWGKRTVQLPPRDPIPTFTSRKLSTLSELREAMSAWVKEFSEDGEEGPFEEDVASIVTYLGRVVTEERDMQKAVSVVDWITYLVADCDFRPGLLKDGWEKAVKQLKDGVQVAVKKRGLPPVEFSGT
jgi:DNA repair protein REV1